MARPIRVEFKGASYHILSGENEQRDIFFGDDDYKVFLGILERAFQEHYKTQPIRSNSQKRYSGPRCPALFFKGDRFIYEQTNRRVIRSNLFCGEPQGKHCQIRNIQAI